MRNILVTVLLLIIIVELYHVSVNKAGAGAADLRSSGERTAQSISAIDPAGP